MRFPYVHRFRSALALAALLSFSSIGFAEEFEIRAVVVGDAQAPGFPNDHVLRPGFNDVLGIYDDGTILFRAEVYGPDGESLFASALFTEKDGVIQRVLASGDEVISGGGLVFGVDDAIATPSGVFAAYCDTVIGIEGGEGIVLGDASSAAAVVATGLNFSGDCSVVEVGEFRFARAAAGGGAAVYEADIACTDADRIALIRATDSDVAVLLRTGDRLEGDFLELGFRTLSMTRDGVVLTVGRLGDDEERVAEEAVILVVPGAAAAVVAREGDAAPGQGGQLYGALSDATFPDILVSEISGGVSMRWAARIFETGDTVVYAAAGAETPSPIVRTGDTFAGVTFVGAGSTRLYDAGAGRTVIFGQAGGTAQDNGPFAPLGVWLFDPSKSGAARVRLVAYTGQPVADAGTLALIDAVACNAAGRVAVRGVISGERNRGAHLMDVDGVLQVVVQEGDLLPDGRNGEARLGFLGFPRSSGTGLAGRGVRFSPSGELVFKASVEGGANGVFVIMPKGGNSGGGGGGGSVPSVIVKQSKSGAITIVGTKGDDELTITQESEDSMTVTPSLGTLVNGRFEPATFQKFSGVLKADLKAGDDVLDLLGGEPDGEGLTPSETALQLRALAIKASDGDDRVSIRDVVVEGSLRLDSGAARDLDEIRLVRALIRSGIVFKAGKGGRTSAALDRVDVQGRFSYRAGTAAGDHTLDLRQCTFGSKATYKGSKTGNNVITGEGVWGMTAWKWKFGKGLRDTFDVGGIAGARSMSMTAGAETSEIDVRADFTVVERLDLKKIGGTIDVHYEQEGEGAGTSAPASKSKLRRTEYDGARQDILRYDTPSLGPASIAATVTSNSRFEIDGHLSVTQDAAGVRVEGRGLRGPDASLTIKSKRRPTTVDLEELECLKASIRLGRSDDSVRLSAATMAFLIVDTGSGADSAELTNASFGRALSVLLGKDDDTIEVRGSQLGPKFRIDGGPGSNFGIVVGTQHTDAASNNQVDTVVDDLQFIATLAKR